MSADPGGGITRDGLSLSAAPSGVVDVYFDDDRVFSAAPAQFRGEQPSHLRWPRVLVPYLEGRTRVVVRLHLDSEVLLDQEVQFGSSDEPVAIRDGEGRPLAVDKFGNLVRMFSGMETDTAHELAAAARRLLRDIGGFGVSGFVAFGSLLGAVRDGHIIGHDTDLDVAYLSNHADPASVALEAFALERFLEGRGWSVRRVRVGLLRAVFRDAAGDQRHIDVFTGIHDGRRLILDRFVSGELDRDTLLPLGEVRLEGVALPAPADPHPLLELTYGPSYLVPDPSFRYVRPRSFTRQAWAWMGNNQYLIGRWRDLAGGAKGPGRESEFAQTVARGLSPATTVVDLGCGAGADALWFAGHGHHVVGIDYLPAVLSRANRIAQSASLSAEFRTASLMDVRQALAVATDVAAGSDSRTVFSRNVLDVLQMEGRTNFWLTSRLLLARGGSLHVQFRKRHGRRTRREPGFRPLQPDLVIEEAARHGARVVHREERPRLCRLELTWTS